MPWGMGALDALTTIGPMTRYVEDLDLVLRVIAGPDGPGTRGLCLWALNGPCRCSTKGLKAAFHSNNGNIGADSRDHCNGGRLWPRACWEEAGVEVEGVGARALKTGDSGSTRASKCDGRRMDTEDAGCGGNYGESAMR